MRPVMPILFCPCNRPRRIRIAIAALPVAAVLCAVLAAQAPAGVTLDETIATGTATAWLPTERVARAWQPMVTGQPFDQSSFFRVQGR
jgi:hypothetical protein